MLLPDIIWWAYSKFYSIELSILCLENSGLEFSHRNKRGLGGIYATVTKVLSAEDDSMLYPFLPYATARVIPATISVCSASMD